MIYLLSLRDEKTVINIYILHSDCDNSQALPFSHTLLKLLKSYRINFLGWFPSHSWFSLNICLCYFAPWNSLVTLKFESHSQQMSIRTATLPLLPTMYQFTCIVFIPYNTSVELSTIISVFKMKEYTPERLNNLPKDDHYKRNDQYSNIDLTDTHAWLSLLF